MNSVSLPFGARIGILLNICAYLIIPFSKNSGTFEFPSLALALLLNFTEGLGLTVTSHPVFSNLSNPTCFQVFWKKFQTETLKMQFVEFKRLPRSAWNSQVRASPRDCPYYRKYVHVEKNKCPRNCPWASPSCNLSGLGMLREPFKNVLADFVH